jgi:hypothetical protein
MLEDTIQSNFMGIQMNRWPEDRIFNLFRKYNITGQTDMQFLQTYIDHEMPCNFELKKYSIRDVHLLHKGLEEMKLPLVEGRDYVIKKHYNINRKQASDMIRRRNMNIECQKPTLVECMYITIHGIMKLLHNIPIGDQSGNLRIQFRKLLFWSVVMKDTQNGKYPFGSV